MAKTVLVALRPEDKIPVLLPHLETVVKPGDRIVFLVAYERDVPRWLLAQIALLEMGCENGVACTERMARFTWDEQKTRAEKDVVEPARRMFSPIGVEVTAELYSDTLNHVTKRHLKEGDIALSFVDASSWLRRLKTSPTSVKKWLLPRRRPYPSIHLTYSGDHMIESRLFRYLP